MTTATETRSPAKSSPLGLPAFLLAALPPLFWAGNFLVARAMRDDIPPFQMSFWRWVLAFAILLPIAWSPVRSSLAQVRRELPYLAFLSLIGVTAFNCFIYMALRTTPVVNGALINSLMPAVTFILAFAFLRDPVSPRRWLGLAISLLGAVMVISRGRPADLAGLALNPGDLLVLAGLTFWAGYTVAIRWRPTRLPPLAFMAVTFGLGALFHLPLVGWEAATAGGFTLDGAAAAALLYFAIFPSILAYVLWNRAVGALGPARTGMFMHLMPIFSAALAVVFLGETLHWYHGVGFLLILGGITLVTRPPARRPVP
jgi:drug/metabolite transporter (DMT)-like permease